MDAPQPSFAIPHHFKSDHSMVTCFIPFAQVPI